jgi:hypothetical protein
VTLSPYLVNKMTELGVYLTIFGYRFILTSSHVTRHITESLDREIELIQRTVSSSLIAIKESHSQYEILVDSHSSSALSLPPPSSSSPSPSSSSSSPPPSPSSSSSSSSSSSTPSSSESLQAPSTSTQNYDINEVIRRQTAIQALEHTVALLHLALEKANDDEKQRNDLIHQIELEVTSSQNAITTLQNEYEELSKSGYSMFGFSNYNQDRMNEITREITHKEGGIDQARWLLEHVKNGLVQLLLQKAEVWRDMCVICV